MKKIDTGKIAKIERRISRMVKLLHTHKELGIHHAINHFYYMQKTEELRLLKEQLLEAQTRLEMVQHNACHHYMELFTNWRKDIRWLNRRLIKTD